MKKLLYFAAIAIAAICVLFSCSTEHEDEKTMPTPASTTSFPLYSYDQGYQKALKATTVFFHNVIDNAYSNGEIDIISLEDIVKEYTGLSDEDIFTLESSIDPESYNEELNYMLGQIGAYFKMRKRETCGVSDADVDWVKGLCSRRNVSEKMRYEILKGVAVARLTIEATLSLADYSGAGTRANLDIAAEQPELYQIKGFAWRVFLCNVGCGAVGTIAGMGVQGVVGAAIGAGSCSAGTGAVAVVAGAIAGVITGAVLSTVFCEADFYLIPGYAPVTDYQSMIASVVNSSDNYYYDPNTDYYDRLC